MAPGRRGPHSSWAGLGARRWQHACGVEQLAEGGSRSVRLGHREPKHPQGDLALSDLDRATWRWHGHSTKRHVQPDKNHPVGETVMMLAATRTGCRMKMTSRP